MPEKNITENNESTEPQTKTEKKSRFWSFFNKKRGGSEKPHAASVDRFANGFKLGHELGRQEGMRIIDKATSDEGYWRLTSDLQKRVNEARLPATYIIIAFLQIAWALVAWEGKRKR